MWLYSDLSDSVLVSYNLFFISCLHLRNYFQWLLSKCHPCCFTNSKNVPESSPKLFNNYVVSSLSFLSIQQKQKIFKRKCQVLSLLTLVYHKSFIIVKQTSEKHDIIWKKTGCKIHFKCFIFPLWILSF